MLEAISATLDAAGIQDRPGTLAADSGYWLIANLTQLPDAPQLLSPLPKHGRHGKPRKDGKPSASRSDGLRTAMTAKLTSEDGKARYAKRGVEAAVRHPQPAQAVAAHGHPAGCQPGDHLSRDRPAGRNSSHGPHGALLHRRCCSWGRSCEGPVSVPRSKPRSRWSDRPRPMPVAVATTMRVGHRAPATSSGVAAVSPCGGRPRHRRWATMRPIASEGGRDETMTMKGTVALVTGATAGIGFHTAQALVTLGARVVVTGRDSAHGRAAARQLAGDAWHDQVRFIACDHATVADNRALAEQLVRELDRLDVLVNNVGGAPSGQRRLTRDGYETTLAVNFVGPAALTTGLLPLLRQSDPARVVTVVSSAHTMWKRDPFADLHAQQRYVGIEAYAHAKLLSLLWTLALARRLDGAGVVVNATNPGMAWTPGTQALTPQAVPAWRLVWPLVRLMQRRASPEAAARSSIYLASAQQAAGITGQYFESRAQAKRPSALAMNIANQERAWELAATLIASAPTVARQT
jgi:NAD(P)-dependent dehydrogenase (short-subunit alcohol dehydrogenase family)